MSFIRKALHVMVVRIGLLNIAIVLALALVFLAPEVTRTDDTPFRTGKCVAELQLMTEDAPDRLLGDNWKCQTQDFWIASQVGTATSGQDIQDKQTFSLSFVEFAEDGTLAEPRQLESIRALLHADAKTYLLTYVHGWRNNADFGNADVRKFTILLSYASAFLKQRCLSGTLAYCDMRVRGVFIGWRGRTFREWGPDTVRTVLAAPTFVGRKAVSDG